MREVVQQRGVYEKIEGSGVWWVLYYIGKERHREKVGNKSAAIELYRKRKADAAEGRKLPKLRNSPDVTISDLLDDLLEFVVHHKDLRNYKSRAAIVRRDLGVQVAADLTPQVLRAWLNKQCKTPATSNRYKALISLAYKVGCENGRIAVNPAKMVRHRKETGCRSRFLSDEEYTFLRSAIAELFPQHLASFVVSVHSGMRLTEQFTVDWSQVNLKRQTIELTKTKNGLARTVRLNATAVEAIESLRRPGQKGTDFVFPSTEKDFSTRAWFPEALREAGISDYVWHSNRHTFCSWLAMAGATDRQIMEAAGHKSLAMAARYSHLSPAHTQTVVELLSVKR